MNNKAVDFSSEFDQYYSFFDLEQHPDWAEAWRDQDEQRVSKILYSLGCDVNYGWEITVCNHRTRTTGQVEYGPRMSFKQRVDKEFQKYLSTEDLIACSSSFVKGELMGMSRQSNFTGDAMSKYGCNEVDVEINDTIKE
jgi:hypothetical protein